MHTCLTCNCAYFPAVAAFVRRHDGSAGVLADAGLRQAGSTLTQLPAAAALPDTACGGRGLPTQRLQAAGSSSAGCDAAQHPLVVAAAVDAAATQAAPQAAAARAGAAAGAASPAGGVAAACTGLVFT